MGLGVGSGRGGRRAGAGAPKGPLAGWRSPLSCPALPTASSSYTNTTS